MAKNSFIEYEVFEFKSFPNKHVHLQVYIP
jgi:hypothetical protein